MGLTIFLFEAHTDALGYEEKNDGLFKHPEL